TNRRTGKPGHRWWAITGDTFDRAVAICDGQEVIDWICETYLITPNPAESPANPQNGRSQSPPNARGGGDPTTESSKKRGRQNGFDDRDSDVLDRAIRYLETMDAAISGERGHDKLFRAAIKMVLGFDLHPDVAFQILRDHYNPRCQPAWTEGDIRHKVADADAQPGDRGYLIGDDGSRHDAFDRMVEKIIASADESVTPNGGEWIGDPRYQNHNELAIRFIKQHGTSLRFVRKWKTWIVWDGKRWRKDESGRDSLRLARVFARGLWDLVGEFGKTVPTRDEMGKCVTFIKKTNQANDIENILRLASADRTVLIDHTDLNANPWLINTDNGTIDLRSGELLPHCQSDLITMITPIGFDELASCPAWLAFLDLVFDGDADLIRYVQQLLGYSLIGSNDAHVLPIAWGNGCNGKSSTVGVLINVLGEYATTAMESLVLGDRKEHSCEVADLYGRRFVAINEPESGEKLKESRVKMLTGDSQIVARGMRENPWTFERAFLLWMSTNHKPQVKGTDEAIWRRIKVIPFTVDIRTKTEPIADYDRWLVSNEGAGILNWLIAGCLDYQSNRFIEPDQVKLAVQEYRQEEDHLGGFIDECCLTGQDGYHVTASKLFDAYKEWAGRGEAINKTAFGREMGDRFRKEKPSSGQFRRRTLYHGITLAEPDHDDHRDQF
ncbi:MAG: phage/plasmid primase, P4 family, partial [Rubripirellula sp.]|nr:phage/plasmid primase, P4 family [Rubripirellula sp.]